MNSKSKVGPSRFNICKELLTSSLLGDEPSVPEHHYGEGGGCQSADAPGPGQPQQCKVGYFIYTLIIPDRANQELKDVEKSHNLKSLTRTYKIWTLTF